MNDFHRREAIRQTHYRLANGTTIFTQPERVSNAGTSEGAHKGWEKRKVYALKSNGNYGSGMVVVAADNPEHAKQVAKSHNNPGWKIDFENPSSIEELPGVEHQGEAKVLAHHEYVE